MATYVTKLREKMRSVLEEVHKSLQKAQSQQKQWYDRKAREYQLKSGDQVLLLLPDSSQKFHQKWQGPFAVTRKISDVNYEVEMGPEGVRKIYHINLLKKWNSREKPEEQCYSNEMDADESDVTERGNHNCKILMGSSSHQRKGNSHTHY